MPPDDARYSPVALRARARAGAKEVMEMDRRLLESRVTLPARLGTHVRQLSVVNVAVSLAVLVALYGIVKVGRGTTVSFAPSRNPSIDTDPPNCRTTRRGACCECSSLRPPFAFTLVYGYTAAQSRRAGEDPHPTTRHPPIRADPRIPVDHRDRLHRTRSRGRCWGWSARRSSPSSRPRRGT